MASVMSLVDRAPAPIRRLVYRVASGAGLLGRLVEAVRFRPGGASGPALPRDDGAAVKLFIGPANSAGQGYEWARAVERTYSDTSAVALYGIGVNPFQQSADLTVPPAVHRRSAAWHQALEAYLIGRTHVVWESGLPLLGRLHGADVIREMEALSAHGVAGALLFHGSDIRPPRAHADVEPWSPFRGAPGATVALEAEAARHRQLVARSCAPVFVSTPDLMRWLPDATWCPVVVDSERWHPREERDTASAPPVVVHAPSNGWLKGTSSVRPILRRLDDEGLITYREITAVPHEQMPDFYSRADIVLDQFVLGIYGVAACEAMASGCVVMSHVDDFTRREVRIRTGRELPVVETTAETLEDELRRFAADPAEYGAVRDAGVSFVRAVHDGRRAAAALAGFLGLKE